MEGAAREAVSADRDDLSSKELEEIYEKESANRESKEDVFSEKIELCLEAFELLDSRDVNLDMFKKCV